MLEHAASDLLAFFFQRTQISILNLAHVQGPFSNFHMLSLRFENELSEKKVVKLLILRELTGG